MKQNKILMVVPQYNFRDEEFEIPRDIFRKEDYKVETVSERKGDAIGKFGLKIWIDLPFVEANVHNYDAVVFVGGPGASQLIHDDEALNLARDASRKNKVIGAICLAPSILANAGILNGKKATATESEEEFLKYKGAEFTKNKVEVSGNIVTAPGPEAAADFARKIVDLIEE